VFYFQKTSILPKVFLITAVFQIATTYLMVDFKGIQGAAITNFLTKILQVLVMFFYVKQFYRFKVNRAKLVVYPAILVLLLTIATLLDELCNNFMVYSLIGVASLILGYFTYRKEISISWIKEMLKK